MRSWTQFYPDVLPSVLGCPEPTLDLHLVRAARAFCRGSKVWRANLPAIATVASHAEYAIRYPAQSDLVEFIDATLDGKQIGLEAADATDLEDRTAGNQGPRRIVTTDARTILVMPTPAAGSSIIIRAALQPSETAQGVPDFIGDQYRDEIATGALATLLDMNKAEWRNGGLADKKAQAFKAAIASVQTRAWRALSKSRPRTVPAFY